MRVFLALPRLTVTPGRPVTVELEVTNTNPAIDGISAQVVGVPGVTTVSEPPLLPLFPDTTGRLKLTLAFPPALTAGLHEAEIHVHSAVEADGGEQVRLQIDVLPQPGVSLAMLPALKSGHHRAEFTLTCDNTGNTVLDLALAASDPDRAVRTRFDPLRLEVGPGGTATSRLTVKARRHLLGGDRSHAVTVLAADADLDAEAQARFRQKPLIPRGVRTALVLGIIVALWAGAFLLGLSKAFSSDPATKEVPASFYAAAKSGGTNATGSNALGLIAGVHSDEPPAGAVPKSGVVEGIGGTINGTVKAASTGQGVGRITIQAVQDSPSGPVLVSSAASAADGTYSLVGLLPGQYKLHFTSPGFTDLWYPAAPSETAGTPVQVGSMAIINGFDATVTGLPGSIAGSVDLGNATNVAVKVTVLPEQGTTSGPIAAVSTDATGNYTVPNLPTPGTYDLSFVATGFQAGSDVEVLGGEDHRIANTVILTAGNGDIDGVVTDGTNPLGGVAIAATANGQTVTSATPTTGAVGHFAITGLKTPATYLLTFTKAGFGTKTVAVPLGPLGVSNLNVALVGGTGTVSGQVTGPTVPGGPTGPLGGVTVTVNGGTTPVTTQTLTAGNPGTFIVSGLATPGTYTVTFSDGGYQSQTVPVTLSSSGSATVPTVTLSLSVGAIAGTVKCSMPGVGACPASGVLGGVTVTVTDGNPADVRTTATAATPTASPTSTSPLVNFAFTGLPAGNYAVSFTLAGFVTQTQFLQLPPGQVVAANVTLSPTA